MTLTIISWCVIGYCLVTVITLFIISMIDMLLDRTLVHDSKPTFIILWLMPMIVYTLALIAYYLNFIGG